METETETAADVATEDTTGMPEYRDLTDIVIEGFDEYGDSVLIEVCIVEGSITMNGHCKFLP
jgi:hypothetical protein